MVVDVIKLARQFPRVTSSLSQANKRLTYALSQIRSGHIVGMAVASVTTLQVLTVTVARAVVSVHPALIDI